MMPQTCLQMVARPASRQKYKVEKRWKEWKRRGSEVEVRWKRSGSEVEKRWKRCGKDVEVRWKRGGKEVEEEVYKSLVNKRLAAGEVTFRLNQ